MSAKILIPTLVSLEEFKEYPLGSLQKSDCGIIAVLEDYTPVLYAITPDRLEALLAAEKLSQHKISTKFEDDSARKIVEKITPIGKFAMYEGWTPDADFSQQAAIWGINITEPINNAELAAFVAYWQAEGRLFHHVQWQQKLARSIQLSRTPSFGKKKSRAINISDANYDIPDGFRGE